ncbi:uncharacterized protein Pbp49 [Eurosta solidaginis]|uniref:uncharacterized protein Pbp49 n=1 Tax=Eurosta solidaginis TaxID=178769 RepID=UPI0035316B72
MEEILGVEMRPPISLQQFFQDWKSTLESTIIPKSPIDIQNAMQLSERPEQFICVSKKCSLEHLADENDIKPIKYEPGITNPGRISLVINDINLKTYNELMTGKSSASRNPFKRTRETFPMTPIPAQQEIEGFDSLNFYNDLIVKVRIYRPARAVHTGQSLEKPVFAEEFDCLGTNYLSELRDRIACVCKKKRFFDVSDNPNAELPTKITDPAYFFINNTFYNDLRIPNNPDYSEIIRKWAKKAVGLKDLSFEVAQMEKTRFLDLSVSIGFPQLYQHHGNCEHVFVISQVEVLVPGMAWGQRQQYPRLCSFGSFNSRVCNMCGTGRYTFIVTNSDRQLQDPAYVCSKCFLQYHYIDGKKIGSFQAYRVNETSEVGDLNNDDKRTADETEYTSDNNEKVGEIIISGNEEAVSNIDA